MRLWPRINTDRHGWRIAGCRSYAGQRTCFAVFAFIHVDPWQELLHQMNSTTAPPVIGDRQRLSATMVLSLRSVERRVGKECVSTCRFRGSNYRVNKKINR